MSGVDKTDVEFEELRDLRQLLHAHPEVSRMEIETAARMRNHLEENSPPDQFVSLAGAGFAAIYDGRKSGKTVLLRTELDALPIHEINDNISYRSKFDNVGHMCGHDGHMTIIAGLANEYARCRPASGRVALLFQPDEETGTGARECCEHPNFQAIKPDYVFALHNFPKFKKHEILWRNGVFMSAVRCVAIKFTGKAAHSAMPETGVSPAIALAETTLASQKIQSEFDRPDQRALLVPVHHQMGVPSSGVSPGYGEIYFTLRSSENAVVEAMWDKLAEASQNIAHEHGLKFKFEVTESFSATNNDEKATEIIRKAARKNKFSTTELESPFRAGEDFGEITARYKGAIFGLGAGIDCPELHNPEYDFPDEIIPTGVAMFKEIVAQCLVDEV